MAQIVMFFKAQKYLIEYETEGSKFSVTSELPDEVMSEAIRAVDSHLNDQHSHLTDKAYDEVYDL